METTQPKISNIEIRIKRDNSPKTNKILVYATAWTTIPNLKFKDFKSEDLYNIDLNWQELDLKILKLKLYLEEDIKADVPPGKHYAINHFFEITNGKNADFKFNNSEHNVLLTKVLLKEEALSDPTGTKRTVITYEDTDIIDDTDK